MLESVLMQATSVESMIGIITAVSIIVSAVSTIVLKLHLSPKIDAGAKLGVANADRIIESKDDLTTLARVTYNMLPEEAAQIVDAQNIKLVELQRKLDSAAADLKALADKTKEKSPAAKDVPTTKV
jgi:hypothetical protein